MPQYAMQRVGHFEKVSYAQFMKDIKDAFGDKWSDEEIKEFYSQIKLPKRATKGSSGYDFFSPVPLVINLWCPIKFPTGIRIVLTEGWWLNLMPRSGLGFKHALRFFNANPNIDSDYQYSGNEGHIWVKIRAEAENPAIMVEHESLSFKIDRGDAFAQGVLLPHGITDDDGADGVRNGGLGSTSET